MGEIKRQKKKKGDLDAKKGKLLQTLATVGGREGMGESCYTLLLFLALCFLLSLSSSSSSTLRIGTKFSRPAHSPLPSPPNPKEKIEKSRKLVAENGRVSETCDAPLDMHLLWSLSFMRCRLIIFVASYVPFSFTPIQPSFSYSSAFSVPSFLLPSQLPR